MIIRSGGDKNLQSPYAQGRFEGVDNSYLIGHLCGEAPIGGVLCSFGSDYAVRFSPDGTGCSTYAGVDITSPLKRGKAWYIKDQKNGEVWSSCFFPAYEKHDEYQVSYLPGQATVRSLKDKIYTELTIATTSEYPCEIWRVKIENRSAENRMLRFTTYIEPSAGLGIEAKYVDTQKTLLMRRSLDAASTANADSMPGDPVLFHTSTLAPVSFQTEKSAFIGEGCTLSNPQCLAEDMNAGNEGLVENAIASVTVEIYLPIEGEAEFGFCFGVAESAEEALEVAEAFGKISTLSNAVDRSSILWKDLTSTISIKSSDPVFDALINTWLPYEAYACWISSRTGGICFDSSYVADILRRLYPMSALLPNICKDNILDFAESVSACGMYSADHRSQIALIPGDLLWLSIFTARYIAETGDIGLLDERIALKDGFRISLREQCERVIRLCLAENPDETQADRSLLERVARQWAMLSEDNESFKSYLKVLDDPEWGVGDTSQYSLSKKINHFRPLSQTLDSDTVMDKLIGSCSDEDASGDAAVMCNAYAALVEGVLGIESTASGLSIRPNLPDCWNECEISRYYRGDMYNIHIKRAVVKNKCGRSIIVDGEPVLGDVLPFFGDSQSHRVDVVVG